jgi:anti-anti-sigma factor
VSEPLVHEPVVARLTGEIDLSARDAITATLLAAADEAMAAGADLVVDLAEVSFMDSSGLACLAQVSVVLQQHVGTLRLRCPGPAVLRVLDLAGFGPMIEAP